MGALFVPETKRREEHVKGKSSIVGEAASGTLDASYEGLRALTGLHLPHAPPLILPTYGTMPVQSIKARP